MEEARSSSQLSGLEEIRLSPPLPAPVPHFPGDTVCAAPSNLVSSTDHRHARDAAQVPGTGLRGPHPTCKTGEGGGVTWLGRGSPLPLQMELFTILLHSSGALLGL